MSIKMAIDTYPSPWRQKRRPKVHSRSETDVSPAIKRPLNHVGINSFYVEILAKDMRIETKVGGRRQSRFKEAFKKRRNQYILCRNLGESYDG